MDYLRGLYRRFTQKAVPEVIETEEEKWSRVNLYLNIMYGVLLWEDPKITWMIFGVLHVGFWMYAYLQVKFFGFVFLSFLIAFLTDTYFELRGVQSPGTPQSEAMKRVFTVVMGVYEYFKNLRQESHTTFFAIACLCFLLLLVIGSSVNGCLLAYLCLLSVFFGPLLISKLPPRYLQRFKNAIRTISTSEGMLAERELIPFLTEKERNTTEDSVLDDKPDSISSSLIVGMSSMPSYQEAEGSLDGLDEEDLELPTQPARKYIPAPEEEYSSGSELEERNIDFDSAHFNGDTSSEDEAELGKGLRFSEEYTKEYVESLSVPKEQKTLSEKLMEKMNDTVLANLASVSSTLLSNVLSHRVAQAAAQVESSSSSSESGSCDFEMIEHDDMNEGS